ncbi:MAG: hypothetical protein K2K55_05760 [Duncaniella sp.]|nr:hypothetical protein [Duncaniella sp.]
MENDILNRINRNDGMTVPEGYFEDFSSRMAANLPEQPWENGHSEENVMPRSWWQKVRPYVYLAAMFMGIWCMMQMFDLMRPNRGDYSPERNPVIAAAMSNDTFMDDYFSSSVSADDYDFYDELYVEGFTPASLPANTDHHPQPKAI